MSLLDRLDRDMVQAVKSRDKERLGIIRLMRSDLKNRQIELGCELEDDDVTAVLSQAARKHRESIEQFDEGGRPDLVESEKKRLAVVEEYLPDRPSHEELLGIARSVVEELEASGPRDLGRVLGAVMPRVRGQADGGTVKTIVQDVLSEIAGG